MRERSWEVTMAAWTSLTDGGAAARVILGP